jgi:hypothetical protein
VSIRRRRRSRSRRRDGRPHRHGTWKASVTLIEAAGGALSGHVQNDPLNPTIEPDATRAPNNPSSMKSFYTATTMTLVLHPQGWDSDLELTGQLTGSGVDGIVHHYGKDDCRFSMR